MYARNIASSSALHRCPATPCLLHRCLLCQRLPLLHLCPQTRYGSFPTCATTSLPAERLLLLPLAVVASATCSATLPVTLPSPLHLRHLLIAVYRTCAYHQCFHITDSSRAPRTARCNCSF
ncbi:hypothetical protein BHE74_00045415 [Ensete ventricosum]|nr:hypothetical protein BHE74_00045415 [Ensete ventricosum]